MNAYVAWPGYNVSLRAPQLEWSRNADRLSLVCQFWDSTLPPVPATSCVMPRVRSTLPDTFSGRQRSYAWAWALTIRSAFAL